MFTQSRRRLELIAHELTPANRVDVWGLVIHPLVELVLPAVEVDEQQAADIPLHSSNAHESGIHQIHCLQLLVGGEAVTRVVLGERYTATVKLMKSHSFECELIRRESINRARLPVLQC